MRLSQTSNGGLVLSYPAAPNLKSALFIKLRHSFKLFAIASILICLGSPLGLAIEETQAVRAIMGEARGESLTGKIAIAEAIRNRGHLKGVYGLKANFQEPERVWNEARKAWKESINSNLVKGADHWESTDFKKPFWAKRMIETATIGKHKFYRVKK